MNENGGQLLGTCDGKNAVLDDCCEIMGGQGLDEESWPDCTDLCGCACRSSEVSYYLLAILSYLGEMQFQLHARYPSFNVAIIIVIITNP